MFQDATPTASSFHDWMRSIGTLIAVLLSITNLIYAIKIFRHKDKKEDAWKKQDSKAAAFKSLILDPNLPSFFEFFQKIETQLLLLRDANAGLDLKQHVNLFMIDEQANVRRDFVDLLRVASETLYEKTISSLDTMTDGFTDDIFDETIDLTNSIVFETRILNRLTATRTRILRSIMAYDGSDDTPPPQKTVLSVVPK